MKKKKKKWKKKFLSHSASSEIRTLAPFIHLPPPASLIDAFIRSAILHMLMKHAEILVYNRLTRQFTISIYLSGLNLAIYSTMYVS